MTPIDIRLLRAAALYAQVGMALGLYMGVSGDHSLFPAHAHINVLGWVTLALYGIVYRIYPDVAIHDLPHGTSGWQILVLCCLLSELPESCRGTSNSRLLPAAVRWSVFLAGRCLSAFCPAEIRGCDGYRIAAFMKRGAGMKSVVTILMLLVLLAARAIAATPSDCTDVVGLKRFAGSSIVLCDRHTFTEYTLPTGRSVSYDFSTKPVSSRRRSIWKAAWRRMYMPCRWVLRRRRFSVIIRPIWRSRDIPYSLRRRNQRPVRRWVHSLRIWGQAPRFGDIARMKRGISPRCVMIPVALKRISRCMSSNIRTATSRGSVRRRAR